MFNKRMPGCCAHETDLFLASKQFECKLETGLDRRPS